MYIPIRSFNPRSHEGSDNVVAPQNHPEHLFQSTLPRGERRFFNPYFIRIIRFQSTLPRGERLEDYDVYTYDDYVSIHAPTRGATKDNVRLA